MGDAAPVQTQTSRPRLHHDAAVLDIDLGAIASNIGVIRRASRAPVRAVVKADGFGHGAEAVASTALTAGVRDFGVTSLAEAEALRLSGIDAPILSWLNPVDSDWAWADAAGVEIALGSIEHVESVLAVSARFARPLGVHLQVDVGMSRDGLPPEDWKKAATRVRTAADAGLVRVRGIMGHLGRAQEAAGDEDGTKRFESAVRILRSCGIAAPRHLAATSATLNDDHTHFDGVRVGAGLYGIGACSVHPLRYAMKLSAPLIQIREVPAGSLIGYGHHHRCAEPRRLGLVPLGYGDGLPQTAHTEADVYLGGRRHRILGALSMDQMIVDLGPVHEPTRHRLGARVTVFGPGVDGEPTPEEWARHGRTLPHAILTGIGPRVHRRTHEYRRGEGS